MKINENFVLRQVAGTWVVLPLGAAIVELNGMLSLNDAGALLWQTLEQGADRDTLVQALIKEYIVDPDVARNDVEAFIEKLSKIGCLEK